jgi:hypothetical protein
MYVYIRTDVPEIPEGIQIITNTTLSSFTVRKHSGVLFYKFCGDLDVACVVIQQKDPICLLAMSVQER